MINVIPIEKLLSFRKLNPQQLSEALDSIKGIAEEALRETINAFGELIAKGQNGHYSIHVDYDRSGRVWRSNTEGYYQIFVYDLAGHVTQVVTSTSTFRDETRRLGVDLSEERFEKAVCYNQDRWIYDLQRQDNGYDKSGHLLSQRKEFSVNSSNEVHLEYVSQSQTVDRWGKYAYLYECIRS